MRPVSTEGLEVSANARGGWAESAEHPKPFKNSQPAEHKTTPLDAPAAAHNIHQNLYARFRPLDADDPASEYMSPGYQQPRWEDPKFSTMTERGSPSVSESNLQLTTKENFGGLVIKKFREVSRVDIDADAKSVSNRSVTSESSRINAVKFRPLKLNGTANEPSEISVVKEAFQTPDDVVSERRFNIHPTYDLNDESRALTEHNLITQLEHPVVLETKTQSCVSGLRLAKPAALPTPAESYIVPLAAQTIKKDASEVMKGEITEVVLEVEGVGRFEGELVDGRMNGYGRLFDLQGRLAFEGDFVNNQFQGVGVLHNWTRTGPLDSAPLEANPIDLAFVRNGWDRYEGLFRAGRFHGRGYLFFGPRFEVFARFNDGEIESGCVLRDKARGTVRRLDIYGPELIERAN